MVGVSVEVEDRQSVEAAIREHRLSYPQLYANDEVIRSFFGGDGEVPLPSTFVFGRGSKLVRAFYFPVDERAFEDVLSTFDESPPPLSHLQQLGDLALFRGEHDEARRLYERALALDPDAAFVLAQLGTLLLLEKNQAESLRLLQRATEVDPDLPYAWFRLGWTLRVMGAREQALAAFARATALKPDDPAYLKALGAEQSAMGLNDDARATFE